MIQASGASAFDQIQDVGATCEIAHSAGRAFAVDWKAVVKEHMPHNMF